MWGSGLGFNCGGPHPAQGKKNSEFLDELSPEAARQRVLASEERQQKQKILNYMK
jgi:hypothetical protein